MILSPLSSSPSSSALPMLDLRLDAARYRPSFHRIIETRARNRGCRDIDILCRASGRGFGPEPPKKEKNNDTKTPKDSVPSKPRSVSGGRYTRTGQAPELIKDINKKSSNVVLDREFLEKVESVRRSTLEQKKSEENKINQTIDYDAPIESEQSTIGLGTKVGVGIAVVVFGLVFALGDFLPSGSVNSSDEASIVEKKLTKEEKETFQSALQQYEKILSNSPEDPGALEGASVALVELGEYDRASAFLEKLIKEKPNYVDAYRLLGEVKYALKDFEGSVSSYRRSLAVSDSTDFEVLRGLTNSLIAAKKPDEAVQLLLASRESLNDKNVKQPDISGDANANLDEKTQTVDPIQVDLLLGKAYSDWGHVSDAIAVYDQIISKYPNDFRGYLAKGIILKVNGKVGDAERMFIQARFFASEKAKALVDRYARR